MSVESSGIPDLFGIFFLVEFGAGDFILEFLVFFTPP